MLFRARGVWDDNVRDSASAFRSQGRRKGRGLCVAFRGRLVTTFLSKPRAKLRTKLRRHRQNVLKIGGEGVRRPPRQYRHSERENRHFAHRRDARVHSCGRGRGTQPAICRRVARLGGWAVPRDPILLAVTARRSDAGNVLRGERHRARAVSPSHLSSPWASRQHLDVRVPADQHFPGHVGVLHHGR